MINALKEIIGIPSVTGTPEAKEALEKMLSICDDLGFKTKNIDGRVGYAEIGDGKEMIGILCHLDVVPAGKDWDYEPFSLTEADGKYYGRGIIDDKGPAVLAVFAMKDILESGRKIDKRIRIIFGTMEEKGDWKDLEYYKQVEELPTYGFTPDADFPAIYGEKGIVHAKLSTQLEGTGFKTIEGGEAVNMVSPWVNAELMDGRTFSETGVASHGSLPEKGVNAITKLMEKLEKENVPFAKTYMDVIGYSINGEKEGVNFADDISGGTTFNVGRIYVDGDNLVMEIDIRHPVTVKKETVIPALEKTMNGAGLKVEVFSTQAPIYMDRNGEVITKLLDAYRKVTGEKDAEAVLIGGTTYARSMDNIVAFGPAFPNSEYPAHQKNEHVGIKEFDMAREIYKLAINNLLDM